ncbi:MAG: hypothetical protein DSZ09_05000 [Sulfurovum sp.]|nr:MAG: hypothetical protein DSZ09_05000 [Sulfurovum sp.]
MELPQITLPKIDLPFEISTLIHPAVVHFVVAIPVIILLLEFYNIFAKRKSIGAFSFLLLIFTVIMMVGAFLTGSVDGKEAYDLLSPEGQSELKDHKLIGSYLIFISLAMLIFKLLAMSGKRIFKFLFFMTMIGFILIIFKQGQEGGELVYKYGANVEKVKELDDTLFDIKEKLEEAEAKKVPKKEEKVIAVPKSKQDAVPVSKENNSDTASNVDHLLNNAKKEMEDVNSKTLSPVREVTKNVVPSENNVTTQGLPTP